jgi:hypothetical protein
MHGVGMQLHTGILPWWKAHAAMAWYMHLPGLAKLPLLDGSGASMT